MNKYIIKIDFQIKLIRKINKIKLTIKKNKLKKSKNYIFRKVLINKEFLIF